MNTRLKRLYAEYHAIQEVLTDHPNISIKKAIGNPPEQYIIEYRLKGLEQKDGHIAERSVHLVEISLPLNYPVESPKCVKLTPIFHPNMVNLDRGIICIYDVAVVGEALVELIVRIGKMICYQSFNPGSPRDGEAAKWASENLHRFPLDNVDLNPRRQATLLTAEALLAATQAVSPQPREGQGIEMVTTIPTTESAMAKALLPPTPPAQTCSNCHSAGDGSPLRICVNGHLVCSDCLLECRTCGNSLCVLCTLVRCSICQKILCNSCVAACATCGKVMCGEHLNNCTVCQKLECKSCLLHCQERQEIAAKPIVPQPEVRPVMPIPALVPHDTPSVSQFRTPQIVIQYCAMCGHKLEDPNSDFCDNCGERIDREGYN